MKKIFVLLLTAINSSLLFAQITLKIEGTIVNNTDPGTWGGVNIQRNVPSFFTYRNNSLTSQNSSGYMLQAGDEGIGSNNNNLNGEIITGNKLIWNGTDKTSITHGIFTGFNIDAIIQYNYLNKVPMGIIRKSNGMTNSSGGVAYNIVNKTQAVAVVVKGMNGVNIFNNTFYSDQAQYSSPGTGTWRGIVDIYTNTDIAPHAASTGTKIKNNIFYTKYQIFNIYVYEAACLTGFDSDYNVFYCESGTPMFNYLGTSKTFAQWQALGYDLHSIVINPDFVNFNDFVPAARLDYGADLGTSWQTGLSVNAVWGTSDPATTIQNGHWQVGARIYDAKKEVKESILFYRDSNNGSYWIKIVDPLQNEYNKISIFNLAGEKVYDGILLQEENTRQFNLNYLSSGIYILTIIGNGVRFTKKFIKA